MVRSAFDDFCRAVFSLLEENDVRYLVIGGLAVIAVGEPRTTADADVIAFLSHGDAQALIHTARRAGFGLNLDVELERLQATGTFRVAREPFHLDVILASLPFEESAFRRATRRKLFDLELNFPGPEDLILFKVLSGRPKDLLDAEGVARRHAGRLDRRLMEDTLRPICDLAEDVSSWNRLQDVLARAEADR